MPVENRFSQIFSCSGGSPFLTVILTVKQARLACAGSLVDTWYRVNTWLIIWVFDHIVIILSSASSFHNLALGWGHSGSCSFYNWGTGPMFAAWSSLSSKSCSTIKVDHIDSFSHRDDDSLIIIITKHMPAFGWQCLGWIFWIDLPKHFSQQGGDVHFLSLDPCRPSDRRVVTSPGE